MNNQIPGGSELDKCVQRMKPILFNTEMVRAILDGRKTCTRRCIKPAPAGDGSEPEPLITRPGYWNTWGDDMVYRQPYQPGDILWVRETFVNADDGYHYRADATPDSEQIRKDYGYKYQPSIHMPREAARIFLRVVDVRAERLQDISDGDCEKEGFYDCSSTANGFACAWDNTIKPADRQQYSWDANPWVWVIEFEKCEKPMED